MDPSFSHLMASTFHVPPTDMTSNNAFAHAQLCQPTSASLLDTSARELHAQGWLAVYTRACVALCAAALPHVKGRVALQVDPHAAHDTQAVLDHARAYAREFERAGISKERYFIKIPATGPALNAAPTLEKEGIRTLGTGVFGLAQAIACSQAGMLYISPYLNGEYLRRGAGLDAGEEGRKGREWCAGRDTELMGMLQRFARTAIPVCGLMSRIPRHSTRMRRGSGRFWRRIGGCIGRRGGSSR